MDEIIPTKKEDVLFEILKYFEGEPFYGSGNMMVKLTALGIVDSIYFTISNDGGSSDKIKDSSDNVSVYKSFLAHTRESGSSEITDSPKCVAAGAVLTAAIIHKGQYKPKMPIHESFGVDEECSQKLWKTACNALEIERYM